ncbi:hypothetical protein B0A50_03836 [Salinomyces thailandicus]|uniref:Uncharacterized protein n=1 Tax=Salinomyces thailandicus TaxID=706561 RepID=A0A4V6WJT3_9PEZI|nr:hypothetical protein B0A50_03836 [Salinomyces thailandica]
MAEKAFFHLRRARNAACRTAYLRTYSSESHRAVDAPREQQVQFLRAQDQRHLVEVKDRADALIDQIKEVTTHITENVPYTVQRDPTIPPYITSLKQKIRELPSHADTAIKAIDNAREHLTDLRYEEYPEDNPDGTEEGDNVYNETAVWKTRLASMSEAQKEDMLKSMLLDEEAAIARFNRDTALLLRNARDVEALSRGGSPSRRAITSGGEESATRAGSIRRMKSSKPIRAEAEAVEKKEEEEEAKPASDSSPTSSPGPSLADMQKRLEESYKGG